MTNSEILEFLENSRVQLQTSLDEQFAKLQPQYKSNYWLKKSNLHLNARLIMHFLATEGPELNYAKLIQFTGLSRKCLREHLTVLDGLNYVKRGTKRGYWKKLV